MTTKPWSVRHLENAAHSTRAHHQREPVELEWDTIIANLKAMLDKIDREEPRQ